MLDRIQATICAAYEWMDKSLDLPLREVQRVLDKAADWFCAMRSIESSQQGLGVVKPVAVPPCDDVVACTVPSNGHGTVEATGQLAVVLREWADSAGVSKKEKEQEQEQEQEESIEVSLPNPDDVERQPKPDGWIDQHWKEYTKWYADVIRAHGRVPYAIEVRQMEGKIRSTTPADVRIVKGEGAKVVSEVVASVVSPVLGESFKVLFGAAVDIAKTVGQLSLPITDELIKSGALCEAKQLTEV